ncbi:MAG: hypothetical protein PHH01_01295 [Patescibacteria group bacterium]|nr:hypothetical protein [Patescibacteria group bacterium]
MKSKTALMAILVTSLAGVIYSGYLTYNNYWGGGCEKAIVSCSGGGQPVEIFGLPTCVYGFFMFLIVAILSIIGLGQDKKTYLKSIFVISLIGTLFALGVTIYEMWIMENPATTLPACAYGFFIYLIALIFASLGFRGMKATPPAVITPPQL